VARGADERIRQRRVVLLWHDDGRNSRLQLGRVGHGGRRFSSTQVDTDKNEEGEVMTVMNARRRIAAGRRRSRGVEESRPNKKRDERRTNQLWQVGSAATSTLSAPCRRAAGRTCTLLADKLCSWCVGHHSLLGHVAHWTSMACC